MQAIVFITDLTVLAGIDSTVPGTNGLSYDIALAPLFFVRSDAVYWEGHLGSTGDYGNLWSSRTDINAEFQGAYLLYFNASIVYPFNSDRFYGRSLRCLVVGKV